MMENRQARPLISVVVASYNYEDLIKEAFDSILAQTYDNYEIVVVDDGSTDNSLSVIKQYMAKTDKMRLYTHPGNANRGLPATVKYGIAVSQGEYVAFLECDDLWTPDHLEKKVAVINKYDGVNIVSNEVELFGDERSVEELTAYLMGKSRFVHQGKNQIDLQEIGRLNVIPTFSSVLVSKKLLSLLNYDTPIPAWIDHWLYRQVFTMGECLYHVPDKLTRWRLHADSYNGLVNGREHLKSEDEFIHKGNSLMGIGRVEKDFFNVAACLFRRRMPYLTSSDILQYALQKIHDEELGKSLREKFFWHRIVRFWKNKGIGKRLDYTKMASKLSKRNGKKTLVVFHGSFPEDVPHAMVSLCKALRKQGTDITVLSEVFSPKDGKALKELESLGLDVIVDMMFTTKLYGRHEPLRRFLACFDEIVSDAFLDYLDKA